MFRALSKWLSKTRPGTGEPASEPVNPDYARRLEREIENYIEDVDVHALPDIFHYWSNKYVRPWFEGVGTTHPEDLFVKYMLEAAERSERGAPRFVSIGAGNCDAECDIAEQLIARGLDRFTIECLDINPHMLERGRTLARERGLERHVLPVEADFNAWNPDGRYDAIIANQCLHHVQNLEGLFAAIEGALEDSGLFITSDMIGRNGHQRWPEAERIVRTIWDELEDRYKYNHQWKALHRDFMNFDCSVDSFEGIRAQDILPLLVERFAFHVFIAFGNVIDPFVDRGYGHNFSADSDADRALIDRLHEIDESGFADGSLKPTHMVAVMGHRDRAVDEPYHARGLAPEQAVRHVG